jgi:DNA-binding NarL/FixJ family response regulator
MSDVSITRLAIVDCHPVVGRGLRDMLAAEADLDVVYECNSFDACLEMFGTTEVDLMVLDLTTAGLCGLHSLARARSLWPELPIIVLSDNVGCSRLALQLGAQGFVSTQDDEADILRVVRSAASDTELSVRDVLMLDLMARGVPLREIAEHLHVTPKTVRSYRHQLEAKLDASTVNDLVLKAGKALRADASDER